MTPFFSVVIPLYNKAHYIRNTIHSVLSQSFQDFEIIVVNDGSTDSSLKRAQSFHDARLQIHSTENLGVSHARNFGISKSSGKFIALLDADDYWHSSYLFEIKKAIEQHEGQSVFASAMKISVNKKKYFASYFELPKKDRLVVVDYFKASQDHSVLHCSSSVFKKSAIDAIGLFNEELKTGEDTDYWIRTGLRFKVVFIKKPLATHKVVSNSLTTTNRKEFKAIAFDTYDKQATDKPYAQKFLHQNKFTSALRYKLIGNYEAYKHLHKQLNPKLLNSKQKTLLALPKSLVKFVIFCYNKMSSKKNYF